MKQSKASYLSIIITCFLTCSCNASSISRDNAKSILTNIFESTSSTEYETPKQGTVTRKTNTDDYTSIGFSYNLANQYFHYRAVLKDPETNGYTTQKIEEKWIYVKDSVLYDATSDYSGYYYSAFEASFDWKSYLNAFDSGRFQILDMLNDAKKVSSYLIGFLEDTNTKHPNDLKEGYSFKNKSLSLKYQFNNSDNVLQKTEALFDGDQINCYSQFIGQDYFVNNYDWNDIVFIYPDLNSYRRF